MGLRGHGDKSALDTPRSGGETQVGQGTDLIFARDGEKFVELLNTPNGCPANTEVMTVTVSYQRGQPFEPPDGLEDFICRVGWGVGGARHQAEFDLRLGAQLSFPASHVDVAVRYQAPTILQGVPISRAYAKATVGWGTRPSRAVVTRTFPLTIVPIGGDPGVSFPVPPFAYAFQVYAQSLAAYAATTTIRVFGSSVPAAATLLAVYDGTDARAALRTEGLHLPGAARLLQIVNGAGAAIIVQPSFVLAL